MRRSASRTSRIRFWPTSTRASWRRHSGAALLPPQPSPAADALKQADLFSQQTVCDYLFDKDKIYAYLNLDDNELFIYQRLYDLLSRDISPPDLVIYLQAPTEILLKRAREQADDGDASASCRTPGTCRN